MRTKLSASPSAKLTELSRSVNTRDCSLLVLARKNPRYAIIEETLREREAQKAEREAALVWIENQSGAREPGITDDGPAVFPLLFDDLEGDVLDEGRWAFFGTGEPSVSGGRVNLRILSNLCDQRCVRARISIDTHNGKVETSFPVQLRGRSDREYTITLGGGSARVQLETFNGSVYLVRPGSR